MKIILYMLIILFAETAVSQTHSNKDSLSSNHKSDTAIVSLNPINSGHDSLKIYIVSEPAKNNPFIPVLLGVFFGTLGSGLVAYYSIKRTHKNSLELEKQRLLQAKELRERQYYGFVFAISVTMNNLESAIRKTISQLDSVENEIISNQSFVVTDLGVTLSLSFLSTLTLRFIDYEQYNSKIAGWLISFIHSAENFNLFTSLDQVANVLDRVKDATKFIDSVKAYFGNLREHLTKLEKGAKKINDWCVNELKKSPFDNVIETTAP
jgi:hypothetical protein